jgi:hypothetical protein
VRGVTEAQTSVDDAFIAPEDLFSGNLYVELPGDRWEAGQRSLTRSSNALARRFPQIREAARAANVTVDQFLLDTMFAHLMPAHLSIAALTLQGNEKINIAFRLTGDARPNWPLPKGVALVAKAQWQLRARSGHPIKQPTLSISSFHDGPPGETRSFESCLNITSIQTARMEPGEQRTRNVLTPQLASALPAISELTRDRLKDWSDFLEWKRRLIRANREALRFTSRTIGPDQRSVVFVTVGPDEDALRQAIGRLSRSNVLAAFDTSVSENDWVFQLPEGEREPRGSDIGTMSRGRAKLEPISDGGNLPWPNPVTASVSFSFSDDVLSSVEASEDSAGAIEQALKRIPEAGFIVQSAVQDMSQVDRQDRALRELSDQGGYSPYLARHIFDAAEARKPTSTVQIDRWTNNRLNAAQRSAVEKILSAPDLCLIQGPPGTGKTTVIAESIAQVAQRNDTVLLASQTHNAVDNALSRLPFHPSIRAVRLTRNESRLSEEGQEFLNERALGRYYKSLGTAIGLLREEAAAAAKFAANFTRFRQGAERHVADLRVAEDRHQDVASRYEPAVGRYAALLQQLKASGVAVPVEAHDDPSRAPANPPYDWLGDFARDAPGLTVPLETLLSERQQASAAPAPITDQQRDLIRRALDSQGLESMDRRQQAVEAAVGRAIPNLRSLTHDEASQVLRWLAGESDPVHERGTGPQQFVDARRRELEAQLSEVMEKLKTDASLVSEYQRLQAELDALPEGEQGGTQAPSQLIAYFPEAAEIVSELQNRSFRPLKQMKYHRLARELIRRINESVPLINAAIDQRSTRDELQSELDQAQRVLNDARRSAVDYFTSHPHFILPLPDQPDQIASLELASRVQALLEEHDAQFATASRRQHEGDAWGDIQDDWVADLGSEGVAERDWEAIGDDWLAECNVVGVTCNENPKTLDDPGLTNFDLTIIDEVSKATPLELLMPLMRARRSALVGDHRQLPPMFREGQDAEGLTEESDDEVPEELALTPENINKYEKFVTASLFRTHFERADDSIKERLTVQHRMHPDIMDAVNRFYEGQLTSGIEDPDNKRAHRLTINGRGDLPVISPDKHMVWVDTTHDDRGRPWTEPAPNSDRARTNDLEARLIVRMLRNIDDALAGDPANAGKLKEIGIVSMYQAQVRCIRQEINKEIRDRPFKAIKYELNTVVKYQGKEKPIILVSMVRNFGPKASNRRRSSRANVARFEYINVAFSRAQELLVVFGARDTFAPYEVELPPMDATGSPTVATVYREICDVVDRNGALKQASALGELLPTHTGATRR